MPDDLSYTAALDRDYRGERVSRRVSQSQLVDPVRRRLGSGLAINPFLRLATLTLVILLVASVGAAQARNPTLRYQSLDSGPYYGNRVTVANPSSGEANTANNNFFVTSVWALSGSSGPEGLQQGVTYEWNLAENACNLGSQGAGAKLYYFTETWAGSTYTCYNGGLATFSTAHKQSVTYNAASTKWSAYLDGVYTGVQMYFFSCGGFACQVRTFGEAADDLPGLWKAKFAGSGNTPWEYFNSSVWVKVFSYNDHTASNWSAVNGPFPTGIWSYTYSH